MQSINEAWRPLKSSPDYAVSDHGRIKRIVDSPRNGKKAGLVLKTHQRQKDGYVQVILTNDGRKYRRFVHVLVLSEFVGPCPIGKECHHKDTIRHHNHLENLVWVTGSKNIAYAFECGHLKARKGETSNLSFLKDGEVWLIKKLLASRAVKRETIAKMFRVHVRTIYRINSGATWSHVAHMEAA